MSISNCVILVIGEVIIDVCLFITCFDPEVIFLDHHTAKGDTSWYEIP